MPPVGCGAAPREAKMGNLWLKCTFLSYFETCFSCQKSSCIHPNRQKPRKTTTIRVICAMFCVFSLPLLSRSRSAWGARAMKRPCTGGCSGLQGHLLPRRCCPASAMEPLPAASCWGAHRHRCCPPWQRQHAFALARWPLKTSQQQQTTLARSRRVRVEGAPARRAGKGVWQGKGVWDKIKGFSKAEGL